MICNVLQQSMKNYLTNSPSPNEIHSAESYKKIVISHNQIHLIIEFSVTILFKALCHLSQKIKTFGIVKMLHISIKYIKI